MDINIPPCNFQTAVRSSAGPLLPRKIKEYSETRIPSKT
jgi:hypothetical protein